MKLPLTVEDNEFLIDAELNICLQGIKTCPTVLEHLAMAANAYPRFARIQQALNEAHTDLEKEWARRILQIMETPA